MSWPANSPQKWGEDSQDPRLSLRMSPLVSWTCSSGQLYTHVYMGKANWIQWGCVCVCARAHVFQSLRSFSVIFLLQARSLRGERSASCSCCHACCLLPCYWPWQTLWNRSPSEPFSSKMPRSWCISTATEKSPVHPWKQYFSKYRGHDMTTFAEL